MYASILKCNNIKNFNEFLSLAKIVYLNILGLGHVNQKIENLYLKLRIVDWTDYLFLKKYFSQNFRFFTLR